MAARAAECDGEIALPFPNIVRQKIDQQVGNPLDELSCLRERADITRDLRIAAGQLLESRDVVGIGKEPDVEHQVAIGGYTVPVAKAGDVDHDLRFLALAAELLDYRFTQ